MLPATITIELSKTEATKILLDAVKAKLFAEGGVYCDTGKGQVVFGIRETTDRMDRPTGTELTGIQITVALTARPQTGSGDKF